MIPVCARRAAVVMLGAVPFVIGGCVRDEDTPGGPPTWSEPVNISRSPEISEIRLNWGQSIAVTASGTVHAVWRELVDELPDPDHARVVYRRLTDAGWQSAEDLTPTTPGVGHPKVAAEGDNVYVVWHLHDPNPANPDQLVLRRSTDDGATFGAAQTVVDDAVVTALNPLGPMSTTPSIAAAADRVHLAWSDERVVGACGGSVPEIYLSTSTDRGGQWSPPLQVSSPDCRTSWTPTVSAAGAYVHVAWTDDRDKATDCGTNVGVPCLEEIYYRRLSNYGETLDASEVRISVDPPSDVQPSWGPSLAVDGGDVFLAFMDRLATGPSGDDWEIYVAHSADDGATWNLPAPALSAHAPGCIAVRPTMAAAAGTVHVVWFEACLGVPEAWIALRSTTDGGQNWSPVLDVSAGAAAFANQPSVAAAPGEVHVLWTDQGEMFYAGAR